MGRDMRITSTQLVAEARAEIEEISVEDAIALHGRDDIVIVDIRDIRELKREGKGGTPYYREFFSTRTSNREGDDSKWLAQHGRLAPRNGESTDKTVV